MKPEHSLAVRKLSCDRCEQLHKRHPDTAADGGTAVWYHRDAKGWFCLPCYGRVVQWHGRAQEHLLHRRVRKQLDNYPSTDEPVTVDGHPQSDIRDWS